MVKYSERKSKNTTCSLYLCDIIQGPGSHGAPICLGDVDTLSRSQRRAYVSAHELGNLVHILLELGRSHGSQMHPTAGWEDTVNTFFFFTLQRWAKITVAEANWPFQMTASHPKSSMETACCVLKSSYGLERRHQDLE